MDTPDAGVVKDSQQSRDEATPKSAAVGAPNASQESWTRHPRSQVRQKAKTSFLADDDDNREEADEQDKNHATADPRKQFVNNPSLASTASDPDSGLDEESDVSEDFYHETPTPHASQAGRMSPQSAQPIPRSSRPDSSDPFTLFESLKRHPPAAVTSQTPYQQKPGFGMQSTTTTKGKGEPPTKDNAPKPNKTSRKSLANSKVKLSALELDGEEAEAEAGQPASHKPQEDDYSLPASASNSPAASPAKKRAAPKRQPVKKPALKPKTKAQEAKTASAGRAKNGRAPPASSVRSSPDAVPGEEECENISLKEKAHVVKGAPHDDKMLGKAPKPGPPVNEVDEDQVMTFPSSSSVPELDNTDDEDFECTGKLTPANSRRKTRAAAARSQALKGAHAKAESKPASVPSSRRPDFEVERRHLSTSVRAKAQPKQPPKKSAVEKTHAVAAGAKSTMEPTGETKSSAEKPEERDSTSERTAAANRTSDARSHVKQDTVASSNARAGGRGDVKEVVKTSEPVKAAENSYRKPNVVTFGPGGPKNNGSRPQKTTATTNSRSQRQQLDLSDGEHPTASKTQLTKGSQKAPKLQLKMTVQDGDSPWNRFVGLAEGNLSRATRTSQQNGARVVPDHAPILKADRNAVLPHSEAETTEPSYETECADVSDQFVVGDAEADTLVEDARNVVADSQGQQKHGVADDFDEEFGREVLEPLARHVKHPHMREHRTVLGEVDANHRSLAKDPPAGLLRSMKRKLPELTTVAETSSKQQPLTSKTGFQPAVLPKFRTKLAALPSESDERSVKKPRYDLARAVRVNGDAASTRNAVGGLESLHRGGGYDTGDDVFGPGKSDRPFGSSAFVQSLISTESADRGPGQAESVAPASSDTGAVPRQLPTAIHRPAIVRSLASGGVSRPQRSQELDEMGRRMLAALKPEKAHVPSPCPPSEEHGKGLPGDDMKDSWLSDTLEQSKALEVDERTRAWKKATEPYAESLGETMHKIVNTILRGLKENEAAIGDVIEDYRKDGQRVVEGIADKHRKERLLTIQKQEEDRLRHVQGYGEARRVTETLLGELESVDIDKMMLHVGKDSTTNRLKRLQQMITDA